MYGIERKQLAMKQKTIYHRQAQLIMLTLLIIAAFSACDQVNEDSLPTPGNTSDLVLFNITLSASQQQPGALDLGSFIDFDKSAKLDISQEPDLGIVSIQGESLIYVPNENTPNTIDQFVFNALDNEDNVVSKTSIEVNVQSDSSLSCDNDVFSLGTMSVSTDSIFVVNLLDNTVVCDLALIGSRAINFHEIANTEGVNIHVSPNGDKESAWLTYIPPSGFTGEVEFAYELCWGF